MYCRRRWVAVGGSIENSPTIHDRIVFDRSDVRIPTPELRHPIWELPPVIGPSKVVVGRAWYYWPFADVVVVVVVYDFLKPHERWPSFGSN